MTITVSGSWAQYNYVEVLVNGKGPRLTLGTDGLTTANVADKIYRMINATAHDDNLLDDEWRTLGGQEVPELTEFEATYPGTGSVVTVKGKPGVEAQITLSASGGTTTLGETQAATGKWFWNNAENWSSGSVPANNDIVYFDHRARASCLYGLPMGNLSLQELHVTQGFSGFRLGLPAINRHDPETSRLQPEKEWYAEYRRRLATFSDESGDPSSSVFVIGEGRGAGAKFIGIKQDEFASKLTVHKTGTPLVGERHVVHFDPDDSVANSDVCVHGGSVALSPDVSTDTGMYTNIDIGPGADVYIGPAASVTGGTPKITQNGGNLQIDTATLTGATITVLGGVCEMMQGATQTTHLKVFAPGVCYFSGTGATNGLVGTIYLSGTLSFARAVGQITWTSYPTVVQMTKGARVFDPQRLVQWHATNGIDLVGCSIAEVTLDLGKNITITKLANDP
tara:strand:- start:30506 stop:31861 length:1356 start_codon:yes stop_codon:yes gene_type:complete